MSDLIADKVNMVFNTKGGGIVHALKDVSFTLKEGELLSVLGPSGCGKTTLLNIIAGFNRPTGGAFYLGNEEISGPGVNRGMVFQQGALFEWLTVAENVNFGLRMKGSDKKETAKKVEEWLQTLVLKIWKETGKTIMIITHSVEEALLLGERLFVMAPRPGRLHKEYNLPFAEQGLTTDPREIKNSDLFTETREEILTMIWDMEEEIMGKSNAA